ncbi:major facilitator superfamily domain-containing protein [Zychaea mexicana]|uniref:major facilitator superfamily domain-containing protein n=1 Tax=Zychaea mexicana TaxID=64656 RepID=UPI0022FE6BAF|nr:major facilitator superfamily domain-containing protein [Zychaea mexicana]KAI9487975.1 major facilitator superfamily domain-containing protein [Zychaea mexicana]
MQDYLVLHMFNNTKRAQTLVSFVGTISYFVSEIMTPLVQIILERLGVRISLLIGTLMVSGGLIASGFATTVWHLYLSQGVCYGAGISTIYLAITTVIPQWFVRRRSTAMGIANSGIGLAGLIIPYAMHTSNTALGASWTFRILGFVYLGANLLACTLVKEKENKKKPFDEVTPSHKEDIVPGNNMAEDAEKLNNTLSRATVSELFTDVNFLTYTASAFLQVLSRNVPFFFLPSYATFIGLSTTQGTSLISIACAASFVGRILVGMLADRFGNLKVAALFGTITGLSSLLLWIFAYTYPALIALAVIIGFSFDTYYILMPPTLLEILGPQKFTTGLSMLMVLTSPAILGPSMISAVDDALNCEQFLPHKVFSGVLPILSSIIMLVLDRRIKKMQ